jgi:hypothetical protein
MDYLVGFIFGFIVKEIYKLLQYLSTSETIIIDHDWDENGIGLHLSRG